MTQEEFTRQYLQSQASMQECASAVLTKELHDDIGQLLSTAKLLLGITERNLHFIPDTFYTAVQTLAKAIQDLRSLSKSLDKEWLQSFNLVENLKTEFLRLQAFTQTEVRLHAFTENLPVDPALQVMFFRLIQELLQHLIKYSGPNHIHITIMRKEKRIQVNVSDDGPGFMLNNESRNASFLSIQRRMQLLGGFAGKQTSSGGTVVVISIPVQNNG